MRGDLFIRVAFISLYAMKKALLLCVTLMLSLFVLSGCSASEEQRYVEQMQAKSSSLEQLATTMQSLWNELADESFNQAVGSLEQVDWLLTDLSTWFIPYAGENQSLQKNSNAFESTLKNLATMLATMKPVLEKAAENPNYTASADDLAALQSVESLIAIIDTAMTDFNTSIDAYNQEQE